MLEVFLDFFYYTQIEEQPPIKVHPEVILPVSTIPKCWSSGTQNQNYPPPQKKLILVEVNDNSVLLPVMGMGTCEWQDTLNI